MESSVQSESLTTGHIYRSSAGQNGNRLTTIYREFEYLNTIGKRFVAAIDRFQVHRALLAALQELYSFSACCILLKGEPYDLFIIPSYPLSPSFLEKMIQRIASAANVIDFPNIDAQQLAQSADLDAPDDLAQKRHEGSQVAHDVGSSLSIPLTVENRIIGMLSLFDEKPNTFDTDHLRFTTLVADYAAVALENVRLHESEKALWQKAELEKQRLELIITSMAEGLLITNDTGAITSLNQSAQLLLAQADVDIHSNIPLHQLARTSKTHWLQRLAEIVDQALTGKIAKNQELIITEEAETVPLTLNISAAPLHNAHDKSELPIGVVAVLNDVTSTKQVERLKDEFVSVVSHELRTPLTSIKGYTQHLSRRLERRIRKMHIDQPQMQSDPPESYDLRSLNIIQSQIEHLERLVSDLLDLSQVQWGKLSLHYDSFLLADLLKRCVNSVQASAEQHTIHLDIRVHDTPVTADEGRIEQVIGNMLDNAVKYSPHGGQITVRLQEHNRFYIISVIDQGIGVSPEHFDHIFERFYRVRNVATRQYSGIGLGLYVSKAIVEGHGGNIWFTNNQGNGTTFNFTLPLVPQSKTHI